MVTIEAVREAICGKIGAHKVRTGYGHRIVVPFTDRYGDQLVVYIDREGYLTDAAEYLSELHAMGATEDWVDWAHREEFLQRNNMAQVGRELRAVDASTSEGILSFLQGLSRVTSFFQIQVEDRTDNRFLNRVRKRMRDQLVDASPEDDKIKWAQERTKRRRITLGQLPAELDLNPIDEHLLVQVIGYPDAGASQQYRHAREKTSAFLAAKVWELEEKKAAARFGRVAVVPALEDYGHRSRKTIEATSTYVLEFDGSGGPRDLLKALATPRVFEEYRKT